jgi:hypothetical protein
MNPKTIKMILASTVAITWRAEAQIHTNADCNGFDYCEQGGTLQILSATGSFSSISGTNKILRVSPGVTLNGTVTLSANDITPGGDIVPLIYTPSWGEDSNTWQLINGWIPIGQSTQPAQVSLTAPSTPGTYQIIFAFSWEKTGDQVASASNWALGHDVWGDGNDIAEFNATQIASAQLNGYALDEWLFPEADGTTQYVAEYIPSDAITLNVVAPGPQPVLNLGILEGFPLLSLSGTLGSNYTVQYGTNLAGTNWINLLSITNLPSSPYPFIDNSGFNHPARFYRAFLMP